MNPALLQSPLLSRLNDQSFEHLSLNRQKTQIINVPKLYCPESACERDHDLLQQDIIVLPKHVRQQKGKKCALPRSQL